MLSGTIFPTGSLEPYRCQQKRHLLSISIMRKLRLHFRYFLPRLKRLARLLLWSVLLAFYLPAFAGINRFASDTVPLPLKLESGAPIMRQFLPQEYKAQGQNWALIQNRRGLMYVGNNDGVLEYDGERWRLIPIANQTTARSLCIDENDRIYVGAVGEIGYLDTDKVGTTHYVSLTSRLPFEDRKFSEVWRCFVTPKGVIFTSFQKTLCLFKVVIV